MDYSNLFWQETNERLFYKVQEMRHSLTRCWLIMWKSLWQYVCNQIVVEAWQKNGNIYRCPWSLYISFEIQVTRLACLLPLLTNCSSLQCKTQWHLAGVLSLEASYFVICCGLKKVFVMDSRGQVWTFWIICQTYERNVEVVVWHQWWKHLGLGNLRLQFFWSPPSPLQYAF